MASLSFSVWSLYKYRVQRSLEMRKFPWRECGGGVRVWFKSFVILHEWIPIITQISERFWAFGFKNFAQNTEYSVPYECDFIISYFNWVVVRLYLFIPRDRFANSQTLSPYSNKDKHDDCMKVMKPVNEWNRMPRLSMHNMEYRKYNLSFLLNQKKSAAFIWFLPELLRNQKHICMKN